MRDSEAWIRFLQFAQSFHRYSLSNLLLILSQRPTATYVSGFRQWQAKGRQVRKGERAIRIVGFAQKKATDQDDQSEQPQTGAAGQKVRTYFPARSVFDIAQTDPIDPDAVDLEDIAHRLTGDDPLGILAAVTDCLTAQSWTVEREPIDGDASGHTTLDGTRRVVIDSGLAPAQAAKTALHEAAHVLLHTGEDDAEYVEHRGIKETEAESVAYVVAGILGLDTSRYNIGYVAGWSEGDIETIKATAARVLLAARTLTDAITEPEPAAAAA